MPNLCFLGLLTDVYKLALTNPEGSIELFACFYDKLHFQSCQHKRSWHGCVGDMRAVLQSHSTLPTFRTLDFVLNKNASIHPGFDWDLEPQHEVSEGKQSFWFYLLTDEGEMARYSVCTERCSRSLCSFITSRITDESDIGQSENSLFKGKHRFTLAFLFLKYMLHAVLSCIMWFFFLSLFKLKCSVLYLCPTLTVPPAHLNYSS